MITTDEQWNMAEAADLVQLTREVDTGQPAEVVILDTFNNVAQTFDKHLARAVAVRLVELAALLPEPPRILPRESDLNGGLG